VLRITSEPASLFLGITNPAFAPNIEILGVKDDGAVDFAWRCSAEEWSSFVAIYNREDPLKGMGANMYTRYFLNNQS
jgi:hypothetical protein